MKKLQFYFDLLEKNNFTGMKPYPLLLIVGYYAPPLRKKYLRYRFKVKDFDQVGPWRERVAVFLASALPASYYYRVFGAWPSHRGRDVASIP